MKEKNKMAFFGTPHFATLVLDELEKAGMTPSAIVTVPDKPAGRGLLPKKSAVKLWAENRHIPLFQPEKLDDAFALTLKEGGYDLCVVAAYGKILPPPLLTLPRRGILNVHPSLLPKFRGPSPIETAILTDNKDTGVSIILLDEKPDHGPIVAQKKALLQNWPVKRSKLEAILWQMGGALLAEILPPWLKDSLAPVPQDDSKATLTQKAKKEDGLIDLSQNDYQNYLRFCAYEGWPGTYFFAKRNGTEVRVKILEAMYENGSFAPTRVVPEGKREMDYTEFVRSSR